MLTAVDLSRGASHVLCQLIDPSDNRLPILTNGSLYTQSILIVISSLIVIRGGMQGDEIAHSNVNIG